MTSRPITTGAVVALAAVFVLGLSAPASAQAPEGEQKQATPQTPDIAAQQVQTALGQPQANLKKLKAMEGVTAEQVAVVDIRQFVDDEQKVRQLAQQHSAAIQQVRKGVRQHEGLTTALEQTDGAAVGTVLALHVDQENGPVLIVGPTVESESKSESGGGGGESGGGGTR